jgi:hypothetical protein
MRSGVWHRATAGFNINPLWPRLERREHMGQETHTGGAAHELTLEVLRTAIHNATRPPLWYAVTENLEGDTVYRIEASRITSSPEWWLFSREAFALAAVELSQHCTLRHISEC